MSNVRVEDLTPYIYSFITKHFNLSPDQTDVVISKMIPYKNIPSFDNFHIINQCCERIERDQICKGEYETVKEFTASVRRFASSGGLDFDGVHPVRSPLDVDMTLESIIKRDEVLPSLLSLLFKLQTDGILCYFHYNIPKALDILDEYLNLYHS